MKEAGFGLGLEYDKGALPAISLNGAGVVLEVHRNELGRSLYFRTGKLIDATIDWGQSTYYGGGNKPQVALNRHNVAYFVNERSSGNHLLDRRVGVVEGNGIRWISPRLGYDHGTRPTVALNDEGIAVEMHNAQNSSWVWSQVWQLRGNDVHRLYKGRIGGGEAPAVALNNHRDIVMVYYSGRRLYYRVGRFTGSSLGLHPDGVDFGTGKAPSVALTDDGVVVVTFEIEKSLYHRTGQLSGNRINWAGEALHYDIGDDSAVAASGTGAVEVHEGRHLKTLWFNASVLTDRASWMQNRMATLGNTRLGDLVLPASHDAAMYTPGLGETQHLTIYEQLRYGIRYFDLRPKWTGRKFVIAHGPINGPDLSEVLDDIRKFALEGRRELAILKLSHFDNINNQRYEELVRQIQASIGNWLVTSKIPKKRLPDVTLGEYVANGTALLVVVDRDYAIDVQRPGFWVYRDWSSAKPAEGDLRVFDQYAKTTDFGKMLKDQVGKFASYKGTMQHDPSLPCDLFLLSWTLTPATAVWEWAKVANRRLGEHARLDRVPPLIIPNEHGRIVNLFYVDFVESARVTDVALLHNREALPVAVESEPRKRRAPAVAKPASARLPVKAATSAKAKATSTKAKTSAKARASGKATTSGKARRSPKPRISTAKS
jgi:hypothetical protein